MTSVSKVYDAFLGKILDDEWETWTNEEMEEDLEMLMSAAISWFKFPRVSLEYEDGNFIDDLGRDEINIIATYMKCEWYNRCIMRWENVKPLYEERDFSQANLIDKFRLLLEEEQKQAKRLESKYYRSINNSPYPYRVLGKQE